MDPKTIENLKDAFSGESQAHLKYQFFAEVAEKEGKPNIARLFRAISYAELVHAKNHFRALGNLKKTVDHLTAAIAGETFEVEEMYPPYRDHAKAKGDKEAERSTHWALEAEKIHAEMYKQAKSAAEKGQDLELKSVYICPVCGYTEEGEQTETCPVCGVKRSLYKKF
ncbi:MAG: rubrerythrin family protein [Candidatus Omnitrophica bacterium]|nr:rubrerythrin family protein [Candidatus Omnitrophota bacterium]